MFDKLPLMDRQRRFGAPHVVGESFSSPLLNGLQYRRAPLAEYPPGSAVSDIASLVESDGDEVLAAKLEHETKYEQVKVLTKMLETCRENWVPRMGPKITVAAGFYLASLADTCFELRADSPMLKALAFNRPDANAMLSWIAALARIM